MFCFYNLLETEGYYVSEKLLILMTLQAKNNIEDFYDAVNQTPAIPIPGIEVLARYWY